MTAESRLLGAALAGGKSRRFGRDKATAEVGGTSLVERAVAALRQVTDQVVVVSDRALPVDTSRVTDLRSGAGPLGGIESALSTARDRRFAGVLVLACDMPLVRDATLRALCDAVLAGAPAAVAVGDASTVGEPKPYAFEPLCAAYRTELLADVTALLDEGSRTAGALFDRVGGARVACTPTELLNVNTSQDAAAAEAALSGAAS